MTIEMIRAIETRYKGYRFRSRLEARWAVFFDALGLRWEYEPEGYNLGEAGYYLPDFFLPDLGGGTWVEVKPDGATTTSADAAKWIALAKKTAHPILLAVGVPGDRYEYDHFDPAWAGQGIGWLEVTWDMKYLPPRNHDGDPRLFFQPGGPEDFTAHIAANAARAARFEHGESP